MLFLADESCDFAVVRALRDEGHDVLAVAEAARGAKDPEVVRLARDEGRVLLTEDKDFGWYVYVAGERGWASYRFESRPVRGESSAVRFSRPCEARTTACCAPSP